MNEEYFKKYQIFIIPVLILIFVGILTNFFIVPKIREARVTYEENKQLQEKAIKLEAKVKKLKELKNSNMIADFEKMEKILPSEKNITYLISSLTKLELDNSLNYNSIVLKPGTIKEAEKPKPKKLAATDEQTAETTQITPTPAPVFDLTNQTIKFSLSFIVKPDTALDFIDKLQEATPIYSVTKADFSLTDNIGNVALEIETYFLGLPVTLGDIEAPLAEISEKEKKTLSGLGSFNIIDEQPVDYVMVSSPSGAVKVTNNIFKM